LLRKLSQIVRGSNKCLSTIHHIYFFFNGKCIIVIIKNCFCEFARYVREEASVSRHFCWANIDAGNWRPKESCTNRNATYPQSARHYPNDEERVIRRNLNSALSRRFGRNSTCAAKHAQVSTFHLPRRRCLSVFVTVSSPSMRVSRGFLQVILLQVIVGQSGPFWAIFGYTGHTRPEDNHCPPFYSSCIASSLSSTSITKVLVRSAEKLRKVCPEKDGNATRGWILLVIQTPAEILECEHVRFLLNRSPHIQNLKPRKHVIVPRGQFALASLASVSRRARKLILNLLFCRHASCVSHETSSRFLAPISRR
jgi:hypothetical protein